MKVNRIIANITAARPADVDAFYQGILGLELTMDHGWIRTRLWYARNPRFQRERKAAAAPI